LSDVCSISQSRNAQSIGLNPIVPDIATRNLRVSKLLARVGNLSNNETALQWAALGNLWQQNNNDR
jgi:hypothetical protein